MAYAGQYGPEALLDTAGNALVGATVTVPTGYTKSVDAKANLTVNGPASDAVVISVTPAGGVATSFTIRVEPLVTDLTSVQTTVAGKIDTAAANTQFLSQAAGAGLTQGALQTADGSVPLGTTSAKFIRPAFMPHYRAKLGQVRAGTSDMKILCVGDSTTGGYGSADTVAFPRTSYPAKLAALLNSYHAPAFHGLAIPPPVIGGSADGRWVAGAGWSLTSQGMANANCYTGTAPAGSLVFTPGSTAGTVDSYRVYYLALNLVATLSMTATGGTTANISTNDPGPIDSVVITGTAGAASSLTITATGNSVFIIGVEPFLSTASRIRVGNAGSGGASTQGWVNGPTFGGLPSIKAYAPDLSIISLGLNNTAGDPTIFNTHMGQIIQAAQVSGDVILLSFPPPDLASLPAVQANLAPLYASLANTYGCGLVDLNARWVSRASLQPLGFYFDTLHPSDFGYADVAQLVFAALRSI